MAVARLNWSCFVRGVSVERNMVTDRAMSAKALSKKLPPFLHSSNTLSLYGYSMNYHYYRESQNRVFQDQL